MAEGSTQEGTIESRDARHAGRVTAAAATTAIAATTATTAIAATTAITAIAA